METKVNATRKPPAISLDTAKEIIQRLLGEMKRSEIVQQLEDAQKKAKGELEAIMIGVVPIFFEIQGHIMEQYGFIPDNTGFEQFATMLTSYETNSEFLSFATEFKGLMKKYTEVMTTSPIKSGNIIVNPSAKSESSSQENSQQTQSNN